MIKRMRSLTGHTAVHHDGKLYQPNEEGVFKVDAAHVAALISHGLMPEDEADSAAAKAISDKRMAQLQAENEDLKRQLQESSLAQENENLRAQLADLTAPKKGKEEKA